MSRILRTSLPWFITVLGVTSVCRSEPAEEERAACATAAEEAQELRSVHKMSEARDKLVECSRPSCPSVVRDDCVRWLVEVTAPLPSVVIQATDVSGHPVSTVRVWVDGTALQQGQDLAYAIHPGTHHLHLEADGMFPIDQQITVLEVEPKQLLPVRFSPVPPSPPADAEAPRSGHVGPLPYIFAGVGVAALGSFAYFGIRGQREANELASGCGATKTCSESQVDPVRTRLRIADVSLAVSLVSFGAATWTYLSQRSSKPKDTTTVQVGAAPGSGMLKVNFAF
jgi:hypothetical protein